MIRYFVTGLATALWLVVPSATPSAADAFERQVLVDRAARIVGRFADNPAMLWFDTNIRKAHGVLIVPRLKKGGFIVGGSGGSGVLLARDPRNGQWSPPAFYTIGSITIGLQAGGEISEIILLVMTKRGLDSLLGSTATLGGDISVAAGPVGLGAKGALADIIAYSRSRGLYGGVNIEGAAIVTRDSWNHGYYGRRVIPSDILVRRVVDSRKADGLRQAVARVANGGQIVPATPQQPRRLAPRPSADLAPPVRNHDNGVVSEPLPWRRP